MSIEITLSVSESVVRHAAEQARESERTVEEVLAETLEEAFPAFPVHPRRAEMEREVAAFEAMHAELWEGYPGQFVAVHGGKVVDHDEDQVVLLERVRRTLPGKTVMIDRVNASLPKPLRIRSPRLIRDK